VASISDAAPVQRFLLLALHAGLRARRPVSRPTRRPHTSAGAATLRPSRRAVSEVSPPVDSPLVAKRLVLEGHAGACQGGYANLLSLPTWHRRRARCCAHVARARGTRNNITRSIGSPCVKMLRVARVGGSTREGKGIMLLFGEHAPFGSKKVLRAGRR